MATRGPVYPTNYGTMPFSGAVSTVQADDTSYATWTNATRRGEAIGFWNTFMLNLPAGANITQIDVNVGYRITSALSSGTECGIQLAIDESTLVGTEAVHTPAAINTDYTITQTITTGFPTVAQLNANGLSGRFRATRGNNTTSMTVNVDWVRITVQYEVIVDVNLSVEATSSVAVAGNVTHGTLDVTLSVEATSSVNIGSSALPSFVPGQASNFYQGSGPWTTTLNNVTAGSLLVVVTDGRISGGNMSASSAPGNGGAGTINSKRDGSGTAVWTKVKEKLGTQDSSGADIAIYYAYAISSGTHTVAALGGQDMGIMLLEYSDVVGADPIDNTTDGIGNMSGALSTLNQTAFTVVNNAIVVAGFTAHSNGTLYNPQNSFVERIDNSSATQWAGDLQVVSGGSITPSVQNVSASTQQWVGVAMSLKGTATAGAFVTHKTVDVTLSVESTSSVDVVGSITEGGAATVDVTLSIEATSSVALTHALTFGHMADTDQRGAPTTAAQYTRKFTLTEPLLLTSMSTLVAGGASATQVFRIAIYDDNRGDYDPPHPGAPYTLLAITEEATVGVNQAKGWVELNVLTPIYLAPGDYWLSIHAGPTGSAMYVYREDTTPTYVGISVSDTYGSGPVNCFGTYADDPYPAGAADVYRDYAIRASGTAGLFVQHKVVDVSLSVEATSSVDVVGQATHATTDITLSVEATSSVSVAGYLPITEVGSGAVANGLAAAPITITHGLDIQEGDFILAFVHVNDISGNPAITDNNGATPFTASVSTVPTADGGGWHAIFRRVAGASEPASYSWTVTFPATWDIVLRVFRGVNVVNPSLYTYEPDATPQYAHQRHHDDTTGTSHDTGDITTAYPGSLAIALYQADATGVTYSNPTGGFGNPVGNIVNRVTWTFTKVIDTPGYVPPVTATADVANDSAGYLFAIKPAGGVIHKIVDVSLSVESTSSVAVTGSVTEAGGVTVDVTLSVEATSSVKLGGEFGLLTVGGASTNGYQDHVCGTKFTLSETTLVSKLSHYFSNVGGADSRVRGFIYADNAGVPDALLATTATVVIGANAAAAWVDFPLNSPVSLSAGTYWLGTQAETSATVLRGYYDTGAANQTDYKGDDFADGLDNPWGTDSWYSTQFSVKAAYGVGVQHKTVDVTLSVEATSSVDVAGQTTPATVDVVLSTDAVTTVSVCPENYVSYGSCELWSGGDNALPDGWSVGSLNTIVGTPTYSKVAGHDGDWALRIQYTGVPGDTSKTLALLFCATPDASWKQYEMVGIGYWQKHAFSGVGGVQIYAQAHSAAHGQVNGVGLGSDTTASRPSWTWQSGLTRPSSASVDHMHLMVQIWNIDEGDTIDLTIDSVVLFKNLGIPAEYVDGDTAGWEWEGTPHASASRLLMVTHKTVDVTLDVEATSTVDVVGSITEGAGVDTHDVTLSVEATSSVAVVGSVAHKTVDVSLAVEGTSSVAVVGQVTHKTVDVTLSTEATSSVAVVGQVTHKTVDVTLAVEGTSSVAVVGSTTQQTVDVALATEATSSVAVVGSTTQQTLDVTLSVEATSSVDVVGSKAGGVDVTLAVEATSSVAVAGNVTHKTVDVTLGVEATSSVAVTAGKTGTQQVTLSVEATSSVNVAGQVTHATTDVTLGVEATSTVSVTGSVTHRTVDVTLSVESTSNVNVAAQKTEAQWNVTLDIESTSSVNVVGSVTHRTVDVTLGVESTSTVSVAGSVTHKTVDVTLGIESTSTVSVTAGKVEAIWDVTLAIEATSSVHVVASQTAMLSWDIVRVTDLKAGWRVVDVKAGWEADDTKPGWRCS